MQKQDNLFDCGNIDQFTILKGGTTLTKEMIEDLWVQMVEAGIREDNDYYLYYEMIYKRYFKNGK